VLRERLTDEEKEKLNRLQARVRLRRAQQVDGRLQVAISTSAVLPLPRTNRPRRRPGLPLFVISRRPLHASRFNRRSRVQGAANRGRRRNAVVLGGLLSFLLLCFGLVAGAGAVGVGYFLYYTRDLPSVDNLASLADSFRTSEIYDRHGTLLYKIWDEGKRTYRHLDQISPYVISATLAAEDPTFYSNGGVDAQGIVRAVYINVSGKGQAGGSTITQQLVRRVLLPEKDEKTLERKVREAVLAVRLTDRYSKNEILEIYLNQIYYGQLSYGIAAAADTYYNRPASELSLAQAAMLAGIPQLPERNPAQDTAASRARQQHVLELMVRFGYVNQPQATAALAEDVTSHARADGNTLAPHFVNYVRELLSSHYSPAQLARGGLRITTSLDLGYQQLAEQQVISQVRALTDQHASNGALVAVQPQTGEILAMVGSVDYRQAGWGQYNVAVARRQPGSAFKPFAYALALHKGYTPATVIADLTTSFANGAGAAPYIPTNYDNQEHGPVTLRKALAGSLNIPAVKVLQFAGVADTVRLASDLGLYDLANTSQYGLALVLGGGEVRLLDLTAAYAMFANAGEYLPPVAILEVADSEGHVLEEYQPNLAPRLRSFSAEESYLISSILSDNAARAYVFGEENALKLSRPAAAKTGTTNDYRDNWTFGYTPNLAVGVWLGNNDNSPLAKVAGARGAGPIWHGFMEAIFARPDLEAVLKANPDAALPRDFARPLNIVDADVCGLSGLKPGAACQAAGDIHREFFVRGTEPQQEDTVYRLLRICELPGHAPCQANPYCPLTLVASKAYPQMSDEYKGWVASHPQLQTPPLCTEPGPPSPQPIEVPPIVSSTASLPPAPLADGDFPALKLAITNPTNGTVVRGLVSIRGAAASANFASYRLDFGPAADGPIWLPIGSSHTIAVDDGFLDNWNSDELPEGRYVLRLTLSNVAGKVQRAFASVQVVRSSPSITLRPPSSDGLLLPGRTIQLAADASNAAQVIFLVDGVAVKYVNAAPWQVDWQVLAGEHTITAQARSAGGQTADSQPYRYSAIPNLGAPLQPAARPASTSIPGSPPPFSDAPLSLVGLSEGMTFYEARLTLQVAVATSSGIDAVRFVVDGTEVGRVNAPWTLIWTTSPGDHQIAAEGYREGRLIGTARVSVSVGKASP